ncbi:MAG: hypothetical protein KAW92_13840 [Candidatus Cloacimonetes bacterium]|nr:hypothetical protein [Candidatus Cloacimonadota bacterium]
MNVKKELDVVRKALKDDEGYYIGWQSNIAMAFVDECHRKGIRHGKLHEAANTAAKNFLNLLIKD